MQPHHTATWLAGVLRTKHGRLIKADEWLQVGNCSVFASHLQSLHMFLHAQPSDQLQAEKRLLARPVHPSVESCLHFKQVPVAKFDANGDLQVC